MIFNCPNKDGNAWNDIMEARFDSVSERLVNRYLDSHPDALVPDNTIVREWIEENGVVAGATTAQAKQIEENTENIAAEKSERIASIAAEKSERIAEISVERARIDSFLSLPDGSTTGDAELVDIRIGSNGTTYDSAGEAVRGQIRSLSEDIDARTGALKSDLNQLSEEMEQLKQGGTSSTGGGMNATAQSLLISILQNAVYESDQSAIITALETALKEGGSSGGDTGDGGSGDETKTYYSVLVTKTNCTVNSSATSIEEGGVYVAQITPDEGYTIETVTVTMGGKDVTSMAYSDGSISISNVTGEIVVVATAIETPNDLVYSANWNYGKRQYSATASQDNASFTSSDWIDVTEGQVITATLLESNVIDGTTCNWNGANTSFIVCFRNSSGSAVSPTVGPSSYMNLNNETYPSSQEVIVPSGAVSMCFCLASGRAYFNGTTIVNVSCESLDGRPVWFSLVLSDGGEA